MSTPQGYEVSGPAALHLNLLKLFTQGFKCHDPQGVYMGLGLPKAELEALGIEKRHLERCVKMGILKKISATPRPRKGHRPVMTQQTVYVLPQSESEPESE